jgi:hypothetical protein
VFILLYPPIISRFFAKINSKQNFFTHGGVCDNLQRIKKNAACRTMADEIFLFLFDLAEKLYLVRSLSKLGGVGQPMHHIALCEIFGGSQLGGEERSVSVRFECGIGYIGIYRIDCNAPVSDDLE